MHFLFLSNNIGPTTGGLETLIARMSKWLVNNGHKVTLLANRAQEYRPLFPEGMRIIELGDQLAHFCFLHKARKAWPRLQIDPPSVIKSFHLEDLWISSILSSIIKPTPKVLFGNYFPYIYPRSRNPLRHFSHRPFLLNMARYLPDDSNLCMDREQISQFRRMYGTHRSPTFWPLPIDNPNKDNIVRSPEWGHIVSISRLEPMKEFLFAMIDVVASLRKKGYPVTWTIYGEGRFAQAMKDRIAALGLNKVIEMKGKLAYSEFAPAIQHAYICVGGGTSIVEAGFCGVPCVMPLAYDSSGATYGPWYNFPFGNLGTLTDYVPKTTIESEIERILNLNNIEYVEESKKSFDYAQKYSIETSMSQFLEIARNASRPRISRSLYYYYYAHRLLKHFLKPFQQMFPISGPSKNLLN